VFKFKGNVTYNCVYTRYTREAGVRSLDRKLGAICRAVAVKVAEGQHKETKPDRSELGEGEGVYLFCVLLKRTLLTLQVVVS